MQYEKTAVAAKGGIGDNLIVALMAGAESGGRLDSGKTVPKFKKGWKATDAEKAEARRFFDKCKPGEQAEIRAYWTPIAEKYLAKKQLQRDLYNKFTSTSGNGFGVFSR